MRLVPLRASMSETASYPGGTPSWLRQFSSDESRSCDRHSTWSHTGWHGL